MTTRQRTTTIAMRDGAQERKHRDVVEQAVVDRPAGPNEAQKVNTPISP